MAAEEKPTMEEKIDKAIQEVLAQNFRPGATKADEALKASQAILNLAHAKTQLQIGKK